MSRNYEILLKQLGELNKKKYLQDASVPFICQ